MTPRTVIDKEKRRYEDDPGYTIFRWIYGFVKFIVVMAIGWSAVGLKNFIMDYRKEHADAIDTRSEMLKNKEANIKQDLRLENHEVRIGKLEAK